MNRSDCDTIAQALVFSEGGEDLHNRLISMDSRIEEGVEIYREIAGTDEDIRLRFEELIDEDGGVFKKRSPERSKRLWDQAYKEVRA